MVTLHLTLKDGHQYHWVGCTNIREAKKEVRWTNARGEKRSMAKAFLHSWHTEQTKDELEDLEEIQTSVNTWKPKSNLATI